MDAILLTVTGISLAAAAVMGVLLARMLRDERRRSDARIALLSDLASEPAADLARSDLDVAPLARAPFDTFDSPAVAQLRQGVIAQEPTPSRVSERPRRPAIEPPAELQTRPGRMLAFDDFELRDAHEEVPGVHELFHEQDEPSPWPRRFAVVGGLAAAIAVVVLGWRSLPSGSSAVPMTPTQVSEVVVNTPLELLSLRHTQQDGVFTITGLVQNPRTGTQLTGVKATLFVFGPGGSFITSGRAPLDFTALGPGDESPFVIRVPVKGDVARYRVGFRGDDDRVLSHVDRRSPDAIAQK